MTQGTLEATPRFSPGDTVLVDASPNPGQMIGTIRSVSDTDPGDHIWYSVSINGWADDVHVVEEDLMPATPNDVPLPEELDPAPLGLVSTGMTVSGIPVFQPKKWFDDAPSAPAVSSTPPADVKSDEFRGAILVDLIGVVRSCRSFMGLTEGNTKLYHDIAAHASAACQAFGIELDRTEADFQAEGMNILDTIAGRLATGMEDYDFASDDLAFDVTRERAL